MLAVATAPTQAGQRLPRALTWALLLTPLVTQPIVNADFFREPVRALALEIFANYLPAGGILLGLWLLQRLAGPAFDALAQSPTRRVSTKVLASSLLAGLVSILVHPLHAALVPDFGVPLLVYLQRNVGFTALLVLPSFWLEEQRRLTQLAERHLLEEQKQALSAQLELLRSRTQPHFLFNVLNTIAGLIRDDADLAERTVQRLGSILRHALESSRHDRVELGRELEVICEYLEVQRARYGSRLQYAISIAPGLEQRLIPPFVLEPLVENAVMHGLSPGAKTCHVQINASQRGNILELSVDDDGPGPNGSRHRGSQTSLTDLERRLLLSYGSAAKLSARHNERGGFGIILHLPLERPDA